jgi:hypothetical protein
MDNTKRQFWLAWGWVAVLTLLLGVLALLQYRWIAEVSVAQRGWLQGNLEARLNLLSASFNQRIENAATARHGAGSGLRGSIPSLEATAGAPVS